MDFLFSQCVEQRTQTKFCFRNEYLRVDLLKILLKLLMIKPWQKKKCSSSWISRKIENWLFKNHGLVLLKHYLAINWLTLFWRLFCVSNNDHFEDNAIEFDKLINNWQFTNDFSLRFYHTSYQYIECWSKLWNSRITSEGMGKIYAIFHKNAMVQKASNAQFFIVLVGPKIPSEFLIIMALPVYFLQMWRKLA